MLTFAWFLAAGMKWSSEAISSYGGYMHLISWLLPGFKTVIIAFTGSIDGDAFLGVCGVGNTNIDNMHIFILAPLGKFKNGHNPKSSFVKHANFSCLLISRWLIPYRRIYLAASH